MTENLQATARPSRFRRSGTVVLGLVVSAVFTYLTLRKTDLAQVVAKTARVSVAILSLSLITKFCGLVFMTWRSLQMSRPLHPFKAIRMFKSILVTFAGNNLLPLRMGELLRIDYLAHHSRVAHSSYLAMVGIERLVDAFCLLVVFLITMGLATAKAPENIGFYVLGAAVLSALVAAIFFSRRPELLIGFSTRASKIFGPRISRFVTAKMERFSRGLSTLASTPAAARVLLISVGYWAMSLGSIQLWLWAYGLDLPWYAPLMILAFTSFGTMLPAAPGYVGTYHYFVVLALGYLGVGKVLATSFAIVGHAMAIVPVTLFAIAVLFHDFLRKDLSMLRWSTPKKP